MPSPRAGSLVTSSPMPVTSRLTAVLTAHRPRCASDGSARGRRRRAGVPTVPHDHARPSTTTSVTSAAVAAKTTAAAGRSVPAVRTLSSAHGDQVGAGARRRCAPASVQPSARVPGRGGRGRAVRRRRSGRGARCAAARPAPPRGPPRTGRSPRGCRCPGTAGCRRRPAPGPARCRRPGPVRWSGRGRRRYRCRRAARRPRRSDGWRVPPSSPAPSSAVPCSSSVGVQPYRAWQASFSARCSDRCTCSGEPPASSANPPSAVAGHRAYRVRAPRRSGRARAIRAGRGATRVRPSRPGRRRRSAAAARPAAHRPQWTSGRACPAG